MTTILAFTIIFLLPILLVLFKNILWSTYQWQIKEYKLFRFINYLKYDADNSIKKGLMRVIPLVLLIPLIIFIFKPLPAILIGTTGLIFAFYVYEAIEVLRLVIAKKIVRPKKSIRNILIFLGCLIIFALPVTLFLLELNFELFLEQDTVIPTQFNPKDFEIRYVENTNLTIIPIGTYLLLSFGFYSLLTDLLTPFIVSLGVLFTSPLSRLMRFRTISKARAKLKRFPDLKVIAITGSYGKTTTKEILYQILSTKFKVSKTPKNQNTDVGVAMAILDELKDDTDIFIAEMGAYRIGEIKSATKVLRPNISVVTGVNEQHISLFGSIEKTFQAKYELVEALPEDGVAILNGNNEFTVRMAEKTRTKDVLYFTNLEQGEVATNVNTNESKSSFPDQSRATLIATDIEKGNNQIGFTLKQNNNNFQVKVKLNDLHNISNLLASIAAALEVGMSLEEVLKVIGDIQFDLPHLNEKDGINDSLIIDDSYNTNPDGFISAVDKLAEVKREKKILVTEGILELGQYKREIYKKIIPSILKNCTKLITKDKLMYDELKQSNKDFDVVYTKDAKEMANEIINSVDSDTLLLLEGNIAPQVKEKIIL